MWNRYYERKWLFVKFNFLLFRCNNNCLNRGTCCYDIEDYCEITRMDNYYKNYVKPVYPNYGDALYGV